MMPPRWYYATCGGVPGALFARNGRRLFLPADEGRVHVVQPTDVILVEGEVPEAMHAFLIHEVAEREAWLGEAQ
jgi:hypothetical protein